MLADRVTVCVDKTSAWMMANRLQLNPAKTEILWCTSTRRQHQIPTGPVRISNTTVLPVSQVRHLNADVTMKAPSFRPNSLPYYDHQSVFFGAATDTKCATFPTTRPRHTLQTSIRALVVSKVDYCNSVLAGAPGHLLDRLQSVLNAAARLIFAARKREHITPLLHELHWLILPERIKFRLCVQAYRCLHGTAPSYLAESLQLSTDVAARRRLRSAVSPTLLVPSSRRSTLGDRSFAVAASCACSSLPAADQRLLKHGVCGTSDVTHKDIKAHRVCFRVQISCCIFKHGGGGAQS